MKWEKNPDRGIYGRGHLCDWPAFLREELPDGDTIVPHYQTEDGDQPTTWLRSEGGRHSVEICDRHLPQYLWGKKPQVDKHTKRYDDADLR